MFRRIREFFLLADFKRSVLVIVPIVLLVLTGSLMLYWDHEPDSLDVTRISREKAAALGQDVVVGTTSTATVIAVVETLLKHPEVLETRP